MTEDIRDEAAVLKHRIDELSAFLDTWAFAGLSKRMQVLVRKQHIAMITYHFTLLARIDLLASEAREGED